MILRQAKESDFPAFQEIYENVNLDILYKVENCNSNSATIKLDDQIEIELQLPKEKFQKLLRNRNQKLYVIQEDELIIGIAWMFLIQKSRWKLAILSLYLDFQTSNQIIEIFKELQKTTKEIDVTPISPSICQCLEYMAAKRIFNFYYRLKQP